MAFTYTVLETKDGVSQVEFADSETSLKQTKTVNVGDLTTPEQMAERYEQHMNAFKHRLSIGLIKPPSEPVAPENVKSIEDIQADKAASAAAAVAVKSKAKPAEQI